MRPAKLNLPQKFRPGKESIKSSELWQLGFFAIAHVLIFIILFHTLYSTQFSAVGIYFDYASDVLNGKLPYRDFAFEYPPLSLLFFILPKLLSPSWQVFSVYFQAEVLIFELAGLVLTYLIARRLGKAPWTLLSVYSIAILAVGPIIGQQYDIIPAITTLLALYYFWLGHHKVAWVFLALGTMIKLYPALLAPIFLIIYLRNGEYRRIWSGLSVFALCCLLILSPFLIIGPSNLLSLFDYHSLRGIQLESTYGAILLVAQKLGWTTVTLVFNYGSWNFNGNLANIFSQLSTPIMAIYLLGCYIFIYTQVRAGKSQFTRLGCYALLVILVTLITSKVLSPQYIIWLIPVLALILGRLRYYVWLLFLFMGGLTYYLFPLHYAGLMAFSTTEAAVLCIRNVLLIVIAVLAVLSLRRLKPSD
jgi:uncharacterized membrane protein